MHLHEIQVQDHVDGRSHFILETVHLETHALKHDLCACGERNLLQECRYLRTVECRGREKHVELDWEKPERCNIILAGLVVRGETTIGHDKNQNTHKLHYSSNRPLDIDPVIAIYSNQAGRAADRRELNKSRVVGHDGLEIISPIENHPVEFARNDDCVARDDVLTLSTTKLAGVTSLQKRNEPCSQRAGTTCLWLSEHRKTLR